MQTFLLSVALCIVASNAAAVPLDLDSPKGIAAMWVTNDNIALGPVYIVCPDGTGYAFIGGAWQTFIPSPVPLAQVVDWTPWMLYTVDGRWFLRSSANTGTQWEAMDGVDIFSLPPPCFGTVGTAGKSLGDVKSLFR